MFFSDEEKTELCKVIKLEEATLPWECVLFGYRNVQQAGGGPMGSGGLQCHLYLNSKDTNMKDAIAFVYSDSIQGEVRNNRDVLLSDVIVLRVRDQKESIQEKMSLGTISVEITGEGDEKFVMGVWPNY